MITDCWIYFHVLIGIWLSSLENCLSFVHPWIGLFVFLLLDFRCSLYILYSNHLSDRRIANIFCHSVCSLFTLLMVSFDAIIKNNFYEFYFLNLLPKAFWYLFKNHCQKKEKRNHCQIQCCFHSSFYRFSFYIKIFKEFPSWRSG